MALVAEPFCTMYAKPRPSTATERASGPEPGTLPIVDVAGTAPAGIQKYCASPQPDATKMRLAPNAQSLQPVAPGGMKSVPNETPPLVLRTTWCGAVSLPTQRSPLVLFTITSKNTPGIPVGDTAKLPTPRALLR